MLIINCTKAAADFFSTTKEGKKFSPLKPGLIKTIAYSNNPEKRQWLVHAIKVKGEDVLVVMDCQTRFSITLSELKKGDDHSFINVFEEHLTVHVHQMMTAINADSKAIERSLENYSHQHNSCAFFLCDDKSMQSTINDAAWHFHRKVDESGHFSIKVDLISLDFVLNRQLRESKFRKTYLSKHLDFFYPHYEFLHAWLRQYGECSFA